MGELMSAAFDWGTFVTSVTSAVVVALLVDWGKNTSKKILNHLKRLLVKLWGRLKSGCFFSA